MPALADTKIQGEQAEAMFVFRAMQHGLIVSKPYGDSAPYDFVVQSRRAHRRSRPPLWCVQVKSTHVKHPSRLYMVNARHQGRPYLPGEIDFIAAWVIPENAWYIIPRRLIRGTGCLGLYPHNRNSCGEYEQYREAWHLLC